MHEVLEELDDHVLVDDVRLGELSGDDEHGQRVVGHPRGAVCLLETRSLRQVGAIDRTDVVESQESAREQVVAIRVLSIEPPRVVDQ